ncbi:MFS monocarboxylate transporter [Colletotrichum musicola]|uniref:MFS monocarboxylate transporter n=1 Tax=Colletotrichum musicola TaxID=2175873 RepID=A0A8H6KJ23_9PEZI|nr:MFS monocarboxylate transporter [Colletotrichum musicola]
MTWGYPSTFDVYQLYYTETLGLPKAQVSWIGSIQIFIAFSLCALSGRLADAGYSRHAVLAGSLLATFGTFMTSLTERYWEILLAQGICTGIGLGLMFMPTVSVISSYFKRRRAVALTISAAGTGTGGTMFPATVQYLTARIGFPWVVRCAGFLALLLVVVMNGLLKPRLAPRKTGPLVEWAAFREPTYVLFCCGCFFYFWALYFGFFYVGISTLPDGISVLTFSDQQLRPGCHWLLQHIFHQPAPHHERCRHTRPPRLRLDRGHLRRAGQHVSGVSRLRGGPAVRLDRHPRRAGMYVFSAVYGIAASASQGMFVSSLASLTKDPSKMGIRFGMVCTILAFATLAGPPTSGAIIDRAGGRYVFAQVWGGTVILLCFLMVAAARVWGTGFKLLVRC